MITLQVLVMATVPAFVDQDRDTKQTLTQKYDPKFSVSLHAGGYKPKISDDTLLRNYYELYYHKKHRPWMFRLNVDGPLLRAFGLWGATAGIGTWNVSGKTRVCSDQSGEAVPCTSGTVLNSVEGSDKTTLSFLPLSLGASYRMDLLKYYWSIPLIFYGRAGLQYFFWWNKVGGKTSKSTVNKGKGGTAGYFGTVGAAFCLDILDPSASGHSRNSVGMTSSFVFAEYTTIIADHFGDAEHLDMSANMWSFGVALDFI